MSYKHKYLKYKTKYLNIKKLLGGYNLKNKLRLKKIMKNFLVNEFNIIKQKIIKQPNQNLLQKQTQIIQDIRNIDSEINFINLQIINQNNKTNMKNHRSNHINKNIDYLHNDNIYIKFQLLINQLKTKNIIPKIVIIVGHGVVNQSLNELITYEKHKVFQLYDSFIKMKVDNIFTMNFIESIINYNKNNSITNQQDLLKSINDFKKDIPDLWTAYSEKKSSWRVDHDSLYYLMYSSETKILDNDKKLTMSFTEPGDGLFIIGTNSETNNDYYHFIKIPTNYEKQFLNTNYVGPFNNNLIHLRDIISLFDNFDSSIYFIPVSCQNIVNQKTGWDTESPEKKKPRNQFLVDTNKEQISPLKLPDTEQISPLKLPDTEQISPLKLPDTEQNLDFSLISTA